MASDAEKPGVSSAETIFTAAVSLPAAERSAYVAGACGHDEKLRQRVEALVRAHDAPESFLPEEPSVSPLADAIPTTRLAGLPSEQPGDRIGRYKLLQKLGEGGCGVVYMAEQEQPVRRKVALKIIKLGMDTKQVVARFEAERQALALMDHPSIAKFYDAGVVDVPLTPSLSPSDGERAPKAGEGAARHSPSVTLYGRPYFVMELVGGIKITDYCDQNQLTARQRLDLFIQVCRAIQHAHQKGVIHRDIKPSNILVATQDGVAVPKVIDFGIAKATQGRLTDQTVFTAFEQFIGTPAYMSPEQAQLGGMDVDTRSDIYSLGVLLYELLTGKTPFDTRELLVAGLDAMRRTICEKEPLTPSTRLKQELVAADMRRLKSPAPDGSGSEETIRASSRRLLQTKELIHVLRGDLDWIVMKCLEKERARRYETANGLALDIERHLKQELVVARPPSNRYRFQKLIRRNKVAFAAASSVVAALIVGLGIALWQSIEKTQAYKRAVGAEQEAIAARARAEAKEGRAQTEARKSQQVARFLEDMLSGVDPFAVSGRDTTLLREILDKTATRIKTELTNQPEVEAELRSTIGKVYFDLRQTGKAEEMQREALRIQRSLWGDTNPLVLRSIQALALTVARQNRFSEVVQLHRQGVEIARTLYSKADPRLASALSLLSDPMLRSENWTEAEPALRQALEIQRAMLPDGRAEFAYTLGQWASLLYLQGDYVQSEKALTEALSILTESPSTILAGWAAASYEVPFEITQKARAVAAQGRFSDAEVLLRQALAIRKEQLGVGHRDVVSSLRELTSNLREQGKLVQAESAWRDVLVAHRQLLSRETTEFHLVLLHHTYSVLAEAGQKANSLYEDEISFTCARVGGSEVADSLAKLSSALCTIRNFAEAELAARQCLSIREKTIPGDWKAFSARNLLAGALLGQSNYSDAEPLLIAGYEGMLRREASLPREARGDLRETTERLVLLYQNTSRPDDLARWETKCLELNDRDPRKPPPTSGPADLNDFIDLIRTNRIQAHK